MNLRKPLQVDRFWRRYCSGKAGGFTIAGPSKGPDRNRKVKTEKPRRLRTADSRNCQTLRVPRQSRGFTMIKLAIACE